MSITCVFSDGSPPTQIGGLMLMAEFVANLLCWALRPSTTRRMFSASVLKATFAGYKHSTVRNPKANESH